MENNETQICTKCRQKRILELFPNNKTCKNGKHNICKICYQEYYKNNKEKIQQNYINNKEIKLANSNKYYVENKEKVQNYQNKYIKLESSKEKRIIRDKNKYHNDINYKILDSLRVRFYRAIKGYKQKSILEILGCTPEEYKRYIEKQFLPEMTWENWGPIWEIDHIKECCSFDLTNIEEQKECFHYTNIQPLFKTTKIAESFGYKNYVGNRNKIRRNIKIS